MIIEEELDDLILDEPQGDADPQEVGTDDAPEDSDGNPEKKVDTQALADSRYARLRKIFIAIVIVLVLVILGAGVLIWHNTFFSGVASSDTDTVGNTSGDMGKVAFQAIPADAVPDFATCFGKTTKEAVTLLGARFSLQAKLQKSSDVDVPSLVYLVSGTLNDASGEVLANVSFGLDKSKKIVYVYSSFDLDTLGVQDADIEALADDATVPRSLLVAMGLSSDSVASAALTLSDDKSAAITGSDSSGKQQCVFKGSTGASSIPNTWKVTETYDHSIGKALGDSSVVRTILVELY